MRVRHQHQAGRRFHIETGPNTPPELAAAIQRWEARVRPIQPPPTSTLQAYVIRPLLRLLGVSKEASWPSLGRQAHRREVFLRAASIKAQTGASSEEALRLAVDQSRHVDRLNLPDRII